MTDDNENQILSSWRLNAKAWTGAVRNNEITSRVNVTNNAILDTVLSYKPRTALDIGCGEGWLTRALKNAGVDTLGIDASPELIDAASRAGGNYRCLNYDRVRYAPYKPEFIQQKFDSAVCNFSLLGDTSVSALIAAIPALLNTGGQLIIQTLHPHQVSSASDYKDAWREGSWQGFNDSFQQAPPWYFRTIESWQALLQQCGFTQIQIKQPRSADSDKPLSIIFIASVP